jgi:hypothetical protein
LIIWHQRPGFPSTLAIACFQGPRIGRLPTLPPRKQPPPTVVGT